MSLLLVLLIKWLSNSIFSICGSCTAAVNKCPNIFNFAFFIHLLHAKYQVPNFKNEGFIAILVFLTAIDSCQLSIFFIMCVSTLYLIHFCICKLYFPVFWCYFHLSYLAPPPHTTVTKLVIELALRIQLKIDSCQQLSTILK